MNYGQLKAAFRARANNRQITDAQVEVWLQQTINQVQTLLRTPAQERTVEYHIGDIFNGLQIPGDYLRMKHMLVNGNSLTQADIETVIRGSRHAGRTEYFCRDGGIFRMAPQPGPGSVIHLTYLANFPDLINDTDSNWLTTVGWHIIINGAMKLYAMATREDALIALYDSEFVKTIEDMNFMALDDELNNASIRQPYDDY